MIKRVSEARVQGVPMANPNEMRSRLRVFLFVLLFIGFFSSPRTLAQRGEDASSVPVSQKLTLVQAVICQEIKEHTPQNQAIVFSMRIGRLYCFTSFDPVPGKTLVYHSWFHRDKLSTRVKLSLQPPRWSTFTRIHLRETDKGPWRVEITDREGNILDILRFSITD